MEYLGLKLESICGAGIAGSDFTHYATTQNLYKLFLNVQFCAQKYFSVYCELIDVYYIFTKYVK